MNLAHILAAQHNQFATLAHAWLASGATSFSVWMNGAPLESWPAQASRGDHWIIEPVRVGRDVAGELRVGGVNGPAAQARLQAEASIVSQMARLERDLTIMTSELIDTQDQLLALYDLSQATRNYLDIKQLLHRLAYETVRLVKVEGAFMYLELPHAPSVVEHYPWPLLEMDTLRAYVAEARTSGQELLLSEGQGDNRPAGARNLLLVPIQVHGSLVAALGLVNKGNGDFTSPDMKLARAIVEHAGAQIENLMLYQEHLEQTRLQTEMQLAQSVQLNLLPQLPPGILGLDLWAASRPASRVGGDFYDFIMRPDQSLTFTVGDVSGKGMPAALLMAMTRTVIRNKAKSVPAPTPEMVMGLSNEELYHDFTEVSMFATVFVGQYEPDSRELLYANAGHSPVVYCPAGGGARLLRADGTAMGILPKSLSADQRLLIEPGDVLVVGTDGLSEAHNANDEMFGYDRLLEVVESLAVRPAQAIADGLYQTVNNFSAGQPQDDDQTLVVLKGVNSK
jgi:phosphoserine phosphatase RsbU/P